jgi:MFS family permease
LPFYYGWVVFATCAGISYSSRPLMAVATLSTFVVPMTEEFGWSRGLFSGAVSLGGLCAVAVSPLVGRWVDRYGSSLVIATASVVVGACAIGLSLITQSWAFYALYVPGRMAFASPLELGTSTAVSNWFIRRRSFALALLSVTQGTGLTLLPLVAQSIISGWGWRAAWSSLGMYCLAVGILPALLLMARRPEDMGLAADTATQPGPDKGGVSPVMGRSDAPVAPALTPAVETNFTVHQAINTRAFWILAAFSAAAFMVQAGVSLHQAPHYIQQGLSGSAAALTVSTFAFSQVPGGLFWSAMARRVPVRFLLAFSGFTVGVGALGISASSSLAGGLAASGALGVGVGGLHVLLRLAWADYYGRQYLGSIMGLTLPVQIAGQALGPIVAGFMFDATGDYQRPFIIFAVAVSLAGLMVLTARPPGKAALALPAS